MFKRQKSLKKRVQAFLLCAVIVIGMLPFTVFANENPLSLPSSVSLTDVDGVPFTQGQEITPGEAFNVIYNYETVENIDSTLKYLLPTLSNHLEVLHDYTEETIISLPVTGTDSRLMGTLEINKLTGAMTFQFDERFNGLAIDDFFLQFSVQIDESTVNIGDDIEIHFPIESGTADFEITVVDKEKDPPQIEKSGAVSTDISDSGHVEILWTVKVTNADNPQENISIHDTWSNNQEYVDGSFCKGGVPITEGLTLGTNGFQYEYTDITPSSVEYFTYKTRIMSSAFLKSGVPLTSGNIKCTNDAQVFYPDGSDVPLTEKASASYNHPIKWLYKTSGNVLNRETGEMEWTITLYNNGLQMQNVVLYDRLSPGVSIKDDTATIKIGNNPVQTLNNFQRTSDTDIAYNDDSARMYNLSYNLGSIGNVAVIKYISVITNPDEYDAGAHMPPDTIFDNKAFIEYQIPSGSGVSPIILSPVVEKSGGYDAGLIGKTGAIEQAYHTIKWTVSVNNNNEFLQGATVTDLLTYAPPVTEVPRKKQLCNHIYDDSIQRNKPQYSFDGKNFVDFTPYDDTNPNQPFTYRLVPTGTEVYKIVFYLGDINQKVIIAFRSTATDEIIYANNITNNNCSYENKVSLITDGDAFSYASAEVVYKSDTFLKADARSWYNKTEHSYDFEKNQLPWLMRVNTNKMEMKDICISDTLSEGTSLVQDSMILGLGTGAWYSLNQAASTISIPKASEGSDKPYYTYNEETREIKIYLDDITGSEVGTSNAVKQVVFYVQLDVEHPIFNNPSYPGYIANKNGTWSIPNAGVMENNYLSGSNAVVDTAAFVVYVQHMNKSGTAFKNGDSYSIDYALNINRIQQEFPPNAEIKDVFPAGLRLDASTFHLYEATVVSPDIHSVKTDGTNGKLIKGAEVSPTLYQLLTEINSDDTTTMRVILPEDCGSKMYIAEYSCDVIDVSKAPFTNSASIVGVNQSTAAQTITKIMLTDASGGGTLREIEKTKAYVTKKNSVSDEAVVGAVFGIFYKGILLEKKSTDENGQIIFENLNKNYTYTITELESAPGYLSPVNITETFVATEITDPVRIDFENAPIVGTVQFLKNNEDGVALAGAEFGIWENAEDIGVLSPIATATSKNNGLVDFYSLTAGKTYYISEISAPDGYQKSEEVIVAKMGLDGAMEKLWLKSDTTEQAITTFENIGLPETSLVVSKTVSGNMGNREKAFSFTLNIKASGELTAGSHLNGTKTDANGNVTDITVTVGEVYEFSLAHGEQIKIVGIPNDTEYTVSEEDYSDEGYTSSYITTQNGTALQSVNGNSVTDTIVDGANIEAFTNYSNAVVPTGVLLEFLPYVLILLIAIIGGFLFNKKRRKKRLS